MQLILVSKNYSIVLILEANWKINFILNDSNNDKY